jgi:hypothetical protein
MTDLALLPPGGTEVGPCSARVSRSSKARAIASWVTSVLRSASTRRTWRTWREVGERRSPRVVVIHGTAVQPWSVRIQIWLSS